VVYSYTLGVAQHRSALKTLMVREDQ